jgi:sulfopyruvate decarboxylase subunit alpha
MTRAESLCSTLRAGGLDFFLSVPCKLLGDLIDKLEADPSIVHTPVSREEEGVGMACGAYLAGRKPAIVMQNSGFGNSANAILALLNYYKVPVTFVVSHRGTDGEPIEAQRMMGGAVIDLLKVVGVDSLSVTEPKMLDLVRPAIEEAHKSKRSLAILLPFSFWREQ